MTVFDNYIFIDNNPVDLQLFRDTKFRDYYLYNHGSNNTISLYNYILLPNQEISFIDYFNKIYSGVLETYYIQPSYIDRKDTYQKNKNRLLSNLLYSKLLRMNIIRGIVLHSGKGMSFSVEDGLFKLNLLLTCKVDAEYNLIVNSDSFKLYIAKECNQELIKYGYKKYIDLITTETSIDVIYTNRVNMIKFIEHPVPKLQAKNMLHIKRNNAILQEIIYDSF